jgi:PAS domain S-box-containing protein
MRTVYHSSGMHSHRASAAGHSTEQDRIIPLVHTGVISLSVVSLLVLFTWFVLVGRPISLQLHFNVYGLLSVASFLSNIIAFIFIVRIKHRNPALLWFAVYLLSLAVWAGGEALMRFSATPEASLFWSPLNTSGSVIMPISLYMFALVYTSPRQSLSPFVLPLLIGVSCFYIFLDAHTHLITDYTFAHLIEQPWGYVSPAGPLLFLVALWLSALAACSLLLFYRFRQHTSDQLLRKQTKIFMVAISIPLVGGIVTDGLLPTLGLIILPGMSVTLLTLMSIIISYGILRYRFFSFTPETIANEMLGTMHEAVIGLGPDKRIGYVNAGTEQLLGLPATKLAGRQLTSFLTNKTSTALHDKIRLVFGGAESATIDAISFTAADGSQLTATLTVSRLSDGDQCLVVMTDITQIAHTKELIEHQVTERTKELHEEQAKLRASIESLGLGFLLLDTETNIIIQNKALQHIFGSSHQFTGIDPLTDKLANTKLLEEINKVAKSGKVVQLDNVNAGTKILKIFIGPVNINDHRRDTIIGTVILIADVTEERVLARSKDEFFSIASHELRTPLTSIKGNTSMMLNYYADLINQDTALKEMVDDIYESSGRLIDIVRDFLDVSRIEQGKMVFRYEPVAIDRIIESVFYEMRTIAEEKGISLEAGNKTLDALPKVWADKDRLSQVIYNLIGNAVKFTDKGSVSVKATTDNKYVVVTVTDTGRGIPPENQKLLFHKFQQAGDSLLTRDTTRGTGLGLYISRLMINSMGGKINLLHSEENKGATFYFRIPIATKAQIASAAQPAHTQEKIDTSTGLSK